jgi:hypothetical protein
VIKIFKKSIIIKNKLGVLRTPYNNPCVRQDPSNDKMNSKVTISLEELSQILVAAGISSFQEEHILIIVKNLSTSSEMIKEPKSHELQKYSLCQNTEGDENFETTSDEERPLTPEMVSSQQILYILQKPIIYKKNICIA